MNIVENLQNIVVGHRLGVFANLCHHFPAQFCKTYNTFKNHLAIANSYKNSTCKVHLIFIQRSVLKILILIPNLKRYKVEPYDVSHEVECV